MDEPKNSCYIMKYPFNLPFHSPLLTATAVLSTLTRLIADRAFVTRVAQTGASLQVTVGMVEITITTAVTGWTPPAVQTLTLPCALQAGGHVAVASQAALLAPVALVTQAAACGLVTGGCSEVALTDFGASGCPPALLTSAVAIDRVTFPMTCTFAAVLAQVAPAVRQARALTCDWVTEPMRVTGTKLTTIRPPKFRRTTCGEIRIPIRTRNTVLHTMKTIENNMNIM